ncbi:MAG TPA: EAL domain-containing protein [Macromonas sp.]|nr:EAL domain-containing protein [Macromonas sp.]
MPLPIPHLAPKVRHRGHQVLTVVLLYAGFASLWILLSDRVIGWLLQDPAQLVLAGTLKGWLFVVCTSILLYLLLFRLVSAPDAKRPAQAPPALWIGMALVVLGTGLLTAVMIGNHYVAEKQAARGQLHTIADAKAQQLDSWLTERQAYIELIQSSMGLRLHWESWRQAPSAEHRLGVEERLQQYVEHGNFSRAAIFSKEGAAVWYPAEAAAPQQPAPGLQAAMQQTLADHDTQRVGPWIDGQGQAHLAFLAPLAAPHSDPGTVVLLQIDLPDGFHPALTSWPMPHKSAHSLLFRASGDQVMALSQLPGGNAPDFLARPFQDITAEPGQLLEGRTAQGAPVLGVALPVGDSGWWLLVQQNRDELLGDAIINGLRTVLIVLLALFATGIGIYLYAQRQRLLRTQADVTELQRVQSRLSESEARYRLLAENGSDVIWLYNIGTERPQYVSPSVQRLLGHTAAELLSLELGNWLTPHALDWVHTALPTRLEAFRLGDDAQRTQTHDLWCRHKDGHEVPIELVTTLLTNEHGAVTEVLAVGRDISVRKAAEAQITRLSQATEQSPASVLITNLKVEIEYVNRAFEQISGYMRQEVLGRNPRFLQSGKTPAETYQTMWRALSAGETWSGELINRHKSGREYLQSVTVAPVRNEHGEATHYLSVQLDVTAQHEAEAKAYQLAWFDPLTDLPNRNRLIAELSNTLAANKRRHRQGVLMLLNLDRFKTLNDALGHSAGDRLLKLVGERLAGGVVAAGDMLARVGADEFALLVQSGHASAQLSASEALHLAQALHDALVEPFTLPAGRTVNVTASIGVTLLPHEDHDEPGDVLRRVNTALHRAKRAGGHQTAFFDTTMGEVVSERFAIEQDLRRGLAAGELRLFLQPQVDHAGRTVSAEALVRWQHPEHGLVPPGLFVPVAEESDLIVQLGHWVLQEVCTHLGALRRQHRRLTIAVNISPRQFHQPDFIEELLRLLDETGAPAGDLILEITEGVVLEQVDEVIARMNELTRHGVRFSIDDFGTGYSALSYLRRLPIHELKIDRSFVQDAPRDPNGAALVEAILSVAGHLHLRVVAEGVETETHARFFDAHPQVVLQGYLFGKPEPAQDVLERWLASGN